MYLNLVYLNLGTINWEARIMKLTRAVGEVVGQNRCKSKITMEEIRNENLPDDSLGFVDGLHSERAGSAVPSHGATATDANGNHVGTSEAGPDHPIADRRLHGPHSAGRQRPAPVYYRGGQPESCSCGPARRQGDPRDQRARGESSQAVLSS